MNKTLLYWFCQIFGWSLYAFVNIYLLFLSDNTSYNAILSHISLAGFYLFSTHAYRHIILRRHWLRLPISQQISRIFGSVLALSIINFGFQLCLSYFLGTLVLERDAKLSYIFPIMISYFFWTFIYFIYHYIENYNKSLQYEVTMNELQLNRLRSQLNPHFIFNALNSIRALISENPNKAKEAVTRLSNILRNSMIIDKKRVIPLRDEINTVSDYLALEKIRFEERLETNVSVSEEAYIYDVPPMMIQTLVENSIKHGISKIVAGGLVEVKVFLQEKSLIIVVRNSGQLSENWEKGSKGIGIYNTIQRLKLIYGESARLEIMNENKSFVIAKLTIPQKNNYEKKY